MKSILVFILTANFVTSAAKSKLLDATSAIFDDTVITLSLIERVRATQKERRQVSPFIYEGTNLSKKEILDIILNSHLIRSGIKTIGYTINDEQVESSINNRQKMIGLSRDQLVKQIKSFGLSFDEYFELIRNSIEYNIFSEKIIKPLISVTEQEIKNEFFKSNSTKLISAKYKLFDFFIDKNKINKSQLKSLKNKVKVYRESGVTPKYLSSIDSVVIKDLNSEEIIPSLKNLLRKTGEGEYSEPILINNMYHVYYVSDIKLSESQLYIDSKNRIKNNLMVKAAKEVRNVWYEREKQKHFIKILL